MQVNLMMMTESRMYNTPYNTLSYLYYQMCCFPLATIFFVPR